MSLAHEFNFDGIVGPTHNYAGLSYGNIASMSHKASVSNPRRAALEGLEKMKFLASLGVKQAVLPPHERPHLPTLQQWGFTGNDAEALAAAHSQNPKFLATCSSASAMWAANAATVSPSVDSDDGRVHFTPANLVSTLHRSLETATTQRILKRIFADEKRFTHHDPLPAKMDFADEGAANHTRLWAHPNGIGIQIFIYGRDEKESPKTKFPARQALQASQEIARLHQLDSLTTVFYKQTRQAIDVGAFHNDVVAVGHRDVLLIHEAAWEMQHVATRMLAELFQHVGGKLHVIEVSEDELSLKDAIKTYLFNSQIVTLPNDSLALIAPAECREHERAHGVIDRILVDHNPISAVHYVDVRQSMHNGGGPACLRLRVMLNDAEIAAMHQGVILTEALHLTLRDWIERNYRESLDADDLADPNLLKESRAALDELTSILNLGKIYEFQL